MPVQTWFWLLVLFGIVGLHSDFFWASAEHETSSLLHPVDLELTICVGCLRPLVAPPASWYIHCEHIQTWVHILALTAGWLLIHFLAAGSIFSDKQIFRHRFTIQLRLQLPYYLLANSAGWLLFLCRFTQRVHRVPYRILGVFVHATAVTIQAITGVLIHLAPTPDCHSQCTIRLAFSAGRLLIGLYWFNFLANSAGWLLDLHWIQQQFLCDLAQQTGSGSNYHFRAVCTLTTHLQAVWHEFPLTSSAVGQGFLASLDTGASDLNLADSAGWLLVRFLSISDFLAFSAGWLLVQFLDIFDLLAFSAGWLLNYNNLDFTTLYFCSTQWAEIAGLSFNPLWTQRPAAHPVTPAAGLIWTVYWWCIHLHYALDWRDLAISFLAFELAYSAGWLLISILWSFYNRCIECLRNFHLHIFAEGSPWCRFIRIHCQWTLTQTRRVLRSSPPIWWIAELSRSGLLKPSWTAVHSDTDLRRGHTWIDTRPQVPVTLSECLRTCIVSVTVTFYLSWIAVILSIFFQHLWDLSVQSRSRPLGTTCDAKPGPKSGHTWQRRIFGLVLKVLILTTIMMNTAGYGGGGSGLVMEAAETSFSKHDWHQLTTPDVKLHDSRPPAGFVHRSSCLTTVKKRSLQRAQKRASEQGVAWYKGRMYRPEDFHFMPPLVVNSGDPVKPPAPPSSLKKCNMLHGSKNRVTCFQWNVGGLSRHRLDELKAWLSMQHVQVVTLLETRWQYSGEWLDPDWIHIHSGCTQNKGMGILTLISRKFCHENDLRWHEIDIGRLVHVRIPVKGRSFDLLCGYQHVDRRSPSCMQQREQWWRLLDQTLQCLPHRNQLLIMADFNTNMLTCPSHSGSEWYRWQGQLTRGSQHQDAGRLISILRFHGLTALNSWSAADGPTYIHGASSSRIDFACARKSQSDGVAKQPRYLWNAPFMSLQPQGHVPIVHQIAMFWHQPRNRKTGSFSKQQGQQATLECQTNTDHWHAYLHRSSEVLTQAMTQVLTSDDSSDMQLDSLHAKVNDCFHEFFPATRRSTRMIPWKQSTALVLNKWQHRKIFLNIRNCTGAGIFRAWYHMARYFAHQKEHRKYAAQIRRHHFCAIVQSAHEAACRHDMHRMFSLINRYAPKSARQRIQIRNPAGNIASPSEELQLLRQFVTEIWGGPKMIPLEFSQAPGVPFTVTELATALSRIPIQKAVAHPFAPGIAWRSQGPVIAPLLHQILQQWWGQNPPHIPQCWKDGWMIMLGKPQKPPTSYFNLRPIALQDPVGKALVGLLIQCVGEDTRPMMLPWPVWAYLQKRSTLDAVCRVAFHCSQASQLIASQRPTPHARAAAAPMFAFCGGVSLMLDLERAFDGVSRQKLFGQLHTLNIRTSVIHLLSHWHCDTQYHFQHGQDRVALATESGLRQGCKAAPGLWNCLMLLYLNRVSSILPASWLRSHLNIYADDYQVGGLFYSVSDLTTLLQAFGILLATLQDFSLCINTKKSAALLTIGGTSFRHQRARFVVSQKDCEQLKIPLPSGDVMMIPIQSQVKYLGTIMTYKDCQAATLKHRLCLAKIAQRRLGRWLQEKHAFSIANRFHLWRSTVFPVLVYGLFSTGISSHGITTLQKAMYIMLRQVACDHASRTRHTNFQALFSHHIPTPLQLLRAAANQLLQSITQRQTQMPADDITLQLPWNHLHDLVNALELAQELSPSSVEPALLRDQPSQPDVFQCVACDFFATDVASFRRHCTMVHGKHVHRQQYALAHQFATDGLPECKYCHRIFTTWRRFQVHIERGCEVLLVGPCAADTHSELGRRVYMAGTALAAGELAVRGSTRLMDADLAT